MVLWASDLFGTGQVDGELKLREFRSFVEGELRVENSAMLC